jgi:hypothetical protein
MAALLIYGSFLLTYPTLAAFSERHTPVLALKFNNEKECVRMEFKMDSRETGSISSAYRPLMLKMMRVQ